MDVILGIIVGTLGVLATGYYGIPAVRSFREQRSMEHFLEARTLLKTKYPRMRVAAASLQSEHLLIQDIPILVDPSWVLERPLPIGQFDAVLCDRPSPKLDVSAGERYLPSRAGVHPVDYFEAVSKYDRPANWFDANCYGLRNVSINQNPPTITISVSKVRYRDGFGCSQLLAHESALTLARGSAHITRGPFRQSLGGPFEFDRRACTIGFDCLTIRRSAAGSEFFLHRRDERVAVGQNLTTVVPAGEFQPSDDSPFSFVADLDLWKSLMREYVEELLGIEEVRERSGAPIDYVSDANFVKLNEGRHAGTVRPWILAVGVDPLSWKFSISMVCVFDSPTFDSIFSSMIRRGPEGLLELPSGTRTPTGALRGWAFEEPIVRGYIEIPETVSSIPSLALAWRWRSELGI